MTTDQMTDRILRAADRRISAGGAGETAHRQATGRLQRCAMSMAAGPCRIAVWRAWARLQAITGDLWPSRLAD